MKHEVKAGQTDYTVLVFIPDSASTDGSGKTGLAAANLTVSYTRVETDNDVTVADATGSLSDLSALTDAHADWGLKEVSDSLAPGLYRLDIADAVFATGAWSAVVYVMVTTSAAAASPMEFVLVPESPYNGVSLYSILATALTETSGGLIAAAFKKFFDKSSPTGTINSLADAVPGAAGGGFIAGTNAATTITTSLTTTFTGNVTGSVGSVTGAVGSVTGAVGSVTGAVGSVTGNVGGSVAGSVGSVTGAVGSVTGNVGGNVTGSVGSLATQAKADVNAEVVDALNVDTYSEPGQGAPTATPTIRQMLHYPYKRMRNGKEFNKTTGVKKYFADDGTTCDQKTTASDDGTTFAETEIASGP